MGRRRTSRNPKLVGNPISFVQEISPLDYTPTGYPKGSVQRFAVIDPDVETPERGEPYFQSITREVRYGKTGKPLKKPRKVTTPGATPGTLAFMDYSAYGRPGDYAVYINYMATRSDQRGKGHARRLIKLLFDNAPKSGVTFINFGRIMSPAIWKLYQERRNDYELKKSQIAVAGKKDF